MDLPNEMDSSFLSGSISDQPASSHDHDGLLVEEHCQSVSASPNSSTPNHKVPPVIAKTSVSKSFRKLLLFFQDGSDEKHSPSSVAHDENGDLFRDSGSGEKYQPSSTPSSTDNEKDHCCQSSSEHEKAEPLDRRTKGKSPHPPDGLKGRKKQQGGDKKQNIIVNTSQKTAFLAFLNLDHVSATGSPVERQKKTNNKRRNDEARSECVVDEWEQPQTPKRPPVDSSDDEREEQRSITRKSPAARQKKSAATKHDDYDADGESECDVDEKEQSMKNTARPVKRQKKTPTKQKYDEVSHEEEQTVTTTKSSAKKGKKTAPHRRSTGAKVQVKRHWTDQEKKAIKGRMAKFILLRKVPRKNDCILCIEKESPVLGARTWKDVKSFVCNEITKIKRQLGFY